MDKLVLNDYRFAELYKGQIFYFERIISEEDISLFAELTGDYNPMHCDKQYAKGTSFGGVIVHGMLAGSLFSSLLGMVCPGRGNLYLSQTLNFKDPINPGSKVIVKGIIREKIESINVLIIETLIISEDIIKIKGEAKVKVLE